MARLSDLVSCSLWNCAALGIEQHFLHLEHLPPLLSETRGAWFSICASGDFCKVLPLPLTPLKVLLRVPHSSLFSALYSSLYYL